MHTQRIIGGLMLCGLWLSFVSKPEINWSADVLLTWDDFKGRPPTSSPHGAISSTALTLSHEQFGDHAVFVTTAVFYKLRSWVKSDTKTDYALKHEQGHFDLAEIYARRLRKEISTLNGKGSTIVKKAYRMHASMSKDLETCQKKYDAETQHHLDQAAQDKWNSWIVEQLNSL